MIPRGGSALTWQDADELARELRIRHPSTNPVDLSLEQVRERVLELPRFGDDPDAATSQNLEDIQKAWYEESEV